MISDAEVVERCRAALAEMGWDGIVKVELAPFSRSGIVFSYALGIRKLASPVVYMAAYLSSHEDKPICCWPCWNAGVGEIGERCLQGDCAHPEGPRLPPKELLVPPVCVCGREFNHQGGCNVLGFN